MSVPLSVYLPSIPLSSCHPSLCLSTRPASLCVPTYHPAPRLSLYSPSVLCVSIHLSSISLSIYHHIKVCTKHQSFHPPITFLPVILTCLFIYPSPPVSTHPSVCHLSLCLPLHPFACPSHWSLGRPGTIHNPLASRDSKINSDHRKEVLTGTRTAQ